MAGDRSGIASGWQAFSCWLDFPKGSASSLFYVTGY
jgi:hypothetical protein